LPERGLHQRVVGRQSQRPLDRGPQPVDRVVVLGERGVHVDQELLGLPGRHRFEQPPAVLELVVDGLPGHPDPAADVGHLQAVVAAGHQQLVRRVEQLVVQPALGPLGEGVHAIQGLQI
jgi:hypothetical protein